MAYLSKLTEPMSKFMTSVASFRHISTSTSNLGRKESYQSQKMTDTGTRRIFNSDHDIFRESARRFFREEYLPFREQWEKNGMVSRDFYLKAGKAGMLGVATPAEKGGLGGGWLSAVIVIEEHFYADSSVSGLIPLSNIVMPYISKHGTEEQIEKYIPDMVAGKKIGAIAITEPDAGSDIQRIRTTAVRDGYSWVINGSKIFISNGYLSDVIVLAAMTSKDAKTPAHGMSLFLVDSDSPGFKRGKLLKKLGNKLYDTAELFFEDMRVPYSALLGGESGLNKGFKVMMNELPQERLAVANVCVATSEYMFELARDYVRERKAFGRRIADFQTIQHGLAEIKTEIAVTRTFMDRCNELHHDGKLDSSTASMAKYWTSEKVNNHAYKLQQMFGGYGYMLEYPITRAYADVRLHSIYAGSSEIMKELIARNIVKN